MAEEEKYKNITNPDIDIEIRNLSERFRYLRNKFSSFTVPELVNYMLIKRDEADVFDIEDYLAYVAPNDIKDQVLDEISLRDRY